MPSQYSNLNFHDKYDLEKWRERCAEQRGIAQQWPAYDARMSSVDEYGFRIGPWSLRLILEIWQKPYMWHSSAAIFEHIGYETMAISEGMYRGGKVEVPQDALLAVKSWVPEHFEQARYLMAEALGPELKAGDKFQVAEEHQGLWCLHWRIKYQEPEKWKEKQH